MNHFELINRLYKEQILPKEDFIRLIEHRTAEDAEYLASLARKEAQKIYGTGVFPRGLIEFTNYCKNDCLYCGIRRSNPNVSRYRLTEEQILSACESGYELGYRSFVLQGGEDPYFHDERMVSIVSAMRKSYPDCPLGNAHRKATRLSLRREPTVISCAMRQPPRSTIKNFIPKRCHWPAASSACGT